MHANFELNPLKTNRVIVFTDRQTDGRTHTTKFYTAFSAQLTNALIITGDIAEEVFQNSFVDGLIRYVHDMADKSSDI